MVPSCLMSPAFSFLLAVPAEVVVVAEVVCGVAAGVGACAFGSAPAFWGGGVYVTSLDSRSATSWVKKSDAPVTVRTASTRERFAAIFRIVLSRSAGSLMPASCSAMAAAAASNCAPHPPILSKQYHPGSAFGSLRGGNFERLMASFPHCGHFFGAARRYFSSWLLQLPTPEPRRIPDCAEVSVHLRR